MNAAYLVKPQPKLRRYDVNMSDVSGKISCKATLNAENYIGLLKLVEEYYKVEMDCVANLTIKRIV